MADPEGLLSRSKRVERQYPREMCVGRAGHAKAWTPVLQLPQLPWNVRYYSQAIIVVSRSDSDVMYLTSFSWSLHRLWCNYVVVSCFVLLEHCPLAEMLLRRFIWGGALNRRLPPYLLRKSRPVAMSLGHRLGVTCIGLPEADRGF